MWYMYFLSDEMILPSIIESLFTPPKAGMLKLDDLLRIPDSNRPLKLLYDIFDKVNIDLRFSSSIAFSSTEISNE